MEVHRFYTDELPSVDDIVMTQIVKVEDTGSTAELLEYANMQALLQHSELSRKRIKSISKLVNRGQVMPLVVLRVDTDKKYIDLSRKQMADRDKEDCLERYHKAKQVDNILRKTAINTTRSLSYLYENLAFSLQNLYNDAYSGLKCLATNPSEWSQINIVDRDIIDYLSTELPERFKLVTEKYSKTIEMNCFSTRGILQIQDAIRSTLQEIPSISIKYIAAPHYEISIQSDDKTKAEELLDKGVKICHDVLSQACGRAVITTKTVQWTADTMQ